MLSPKVLFVFYTVLLVIVAFFDLLMYFICQRISEQTIMHSFLYVNLKCSVNICRIVFHVYKIALVFYKVHSSDINVEISKQLQVFFKFFWFKVNYIRCAFDFH